MPEHSTTTTRTSPLHFLYPHLPPLSSTQSSYYSYPASSTLGSTNAKSHHKATKQKRRRTPDHDDISRLLDPSYLPSSSGTSGVYVDPSGEVHDPDYRHFPLVTAPSHGSHYSSAHHGHHNHQHHHHTHGATSGHHSAKPHAGRTRGRTSPRPHFDWELAVDECALDDEYPPEEEENHHRYGYSRGGHAGGMGGLGSASSGRSFSSAKSSPVIVRRPRDTSFSTVNTSPTWYPSPTMTDSTLPTSYEREPTLDDDTEKEVVGKKEEKKRRRLSKGDKEKEKMALKASDEEKRAAAAATRTSFDHALPSTVEEEDSAPRSTDSRASREEEDEDEDEMIMPRHQDYVPTCSQSLRRSWQAFALRFRFGVFRAQRRMTRRVHSIM